jgi:hypothetical protein
MARTLVIHETVIDWSIFDQIESVSGSVPGATAPAVRLAPAQWELLHRYLNRRGELPAEVRRRVADALYQSLRPAARGTDLELSRLSPEDWLVELAKRT